MPETLVIPGNPVLTLPMEVDMANADEVRASLAPLIERGGPVVIDLSAVQFMDSNGIHALAEAATEIADRGCIIIHGANRQVSNLFEIVQLRSIRPNIHIIDCT
jgi:anti-anti-sigma factor